MTSEIGTLFDLPLAFGIRQYEQAWLQPSCTFTKGLDLLEKHNVLVEVLSANIFTILNLLMLGTILSTPAIPLSSSGFSCA
jgi:hypothetical protein